MSLPLLLAAAGLALAAVPRKGSPRWALRARAEVGEPLVRLGDLLAPGAAGPTAALAATVVAAAPQPGTALVWNRAQAAARLRLAGLAARRFAIPEQIEVRRRSWAVARPAVVAAVAAYLHRGVAAAEVEYVAPLTTVAGDPGIQVESARPDVAHGRLVLVCRDRADAGLLPFVVFVRLPAAALAARRRAGVLPAPRPAAARYLVQPGHPAQLVIHNAAFSLTTEVMPLQAGQAGQTIQAVSVATHAGLRVVVIGPNQVQRARETAREAFHEH
ncbi:MAG TPA: hypothetical protein VMV31_00635 [Terriglobales bacterium]|nr:hypothetical protein [Terriglobales bacterium]